ncbi:FAD-dependent oxidoreductase [Desulfitobacterium chlororespirans]|uniref:Tat (Twin-arginine translocation) pathway signal sequence n=1 Tax=Desulfitobacterium chlororespirans DSM 11544 TaxID=1121395 RepID=A0A1M7UI37_9FIRM|nr:FAD-dependent oxidoreductase [Desulfitobacterium chlororespirans]SHN82575.1 Tat (twin-arginine translocation) pathway signal sequence [Desulfitobacterium chlororespirans DSM 11544]
MTQKDKKGISRRDFLRNTGILAGSAVVGSTLLAGCSTPTNTANTPAPSTSEPQWDYEADVVVIGAGGAGLPAAVKAQADGASVIVVEASFDIGGHCAVSGGNLHSGAGTSVQKKHGIDDSPDQYYMDHTTDLTHVSRYNDRDVVRATANTMPEAFEFILANGVLVLDTPPTKGKSYLEGGTSPESVPRDLVTDVETVGWVNYLSNTGPKDGPLRRGIGVVRPLEKTLREKGGQFLMSYHMDKIIREGELTGRAIGVECSYNPTTLPGESSPLKNAYPNGNIETTKANVRIKARKGIIIATGGHTSNVNFRTMFDPRLTIEYDGVAGDPFSLQDASGEIAAMAIGAALGTLANQSREVGSAITQPAFLGCQYGYRNSAAATRPTSVIFPLIRATGIEYRTFEDAILVNALGKRFWNEEGATDNSFDYFAAALGSVIIDGSSPTDARRIGGPIWAIFDSEAVARRKLTVEPPYVDIDDGRFFVADTIEELAGKIVNKYYEDIKMDPKVLADTVARYNGFVDAKKDDDYGKKALEHKIAAGPFYAAWATPCLHDTLTGLRVNGDQQVIDLWGQPIPGLFCGGEASSGLSVHGLGRVITQGYIAGKSAAKG